MDNMATCVCCPVCTLFLREGVTLQDHLNTHPKEQVIEALVRYSGVYSAEGPSKHYQEFVTAFPMAAASMVYPVFPQSAHSQNDHHVHSSVRTPESADVPQSKCGADCVSCSQYAPHKQELIKVDHIYEACEETQKNWTSAPESEEPTNLCLRQSANTSAQYDNGPGVPWMPQLAVPAYQTENVDHFQPRHLLHNGQILRTGGGTIVEAGEGRTLLNLSEPGPMSVLEREGIHFLVPSQFLGNSGKPVAAQLARLDNVPGVAPESGVAPPPPYPKRLASPDMDVADSPCSVADSAPSSPFVKRAESPSPINIRSDEMMPAHGEISEQESVGGNSSSMWPDQNFSSMKDNPYELEPLESPKFVPESVFFSSSSPSSVSPPPSVSPPLSVPPPLSVSLPLSVPPPLSVDVEPKKKKPPRIPKCRWCKMIFNRPCERRKHVCDKRKDKKLPPVEPSTSETVMQKPKRVYKRKPKENQVDIRLNQFADVLVSKLEPDVPKNDVASIPNAVASIPKVVEPLKSFKCENCDMAFSSYRLLAIHRGREHKESRYECATCSEAFELETQYHTHLVVHPLECKLCGKFFYKRKNIVLHMKRHMSIKPYKCEHCDKSFVTKQKLDEHSNSHTGNAPIKCPLCDETFRRYSNLVQHKNRHHFKSTPKKRDFICHCGEVYHSKKKLEWHKEIHDEKPKSCSFCNERFVHASSLTRHVRKAHDQCYVPKVGREVENVKCPICQRICLKSSLAVHMRTHSGAKPFPCHICGKKFTTKWNLQLHRWTHASRSTKPFKCTMCKSAFHRRTDFTSHMRSHRNMRPYTCNYCGCQFIRKYNCIRHMNEHEKSKSYSCTICDKTFHRSYYLKEHMRVHSKTRPYSCHICGKASSSKSNHNKHVKIHHAREPQNTEG